MEMVIPVHGNSLKQILITLLRLTETAVDDRNSAVNNTREHSVSGGLVGDRSAAYQIDP